MDSKRPDETMSVTEAAGHLHVSERTIYRMMKAGLLARSPMSDGVRLWRSEVQELAMNRGLKRPNYVGQVSDTPGSDWQAQLQQKDQQIAELLARQREMSKMLERLQEQLYELTRFVVSQARTPAARRFDWAFWKRGKPHEDRNAEPK